MSDLQDELAERIRQIVGAWPDITEKRMFGSIAFNLNDHIFIAARKDGSALVQVGKARNEEALARPGASQMIMRGGAMLGFIEISPDELANEDDIRSWLDLAEPYVRALPAK